MKQTVKFNREDGGIWYADISEYPGKKIDLMMVEGADTLLDVIHNNGDMAEESVRVCFYTEEDIESDRSYDGTLALINEDPEIGGGWYRGTYREIVIERLWLCDVTKFVFGKMPEALRYVVF